MFTWEEAGLLRQMLQIILWLSIVLLLAGAVYLVRRLVG
jgi:hypothetical protein